MKRVVCYGECSDLSVSDMLSTSDDDGFSIFDDPNADLYSIDDSGVMHAIYTYHGGMIIVNWWYDLYTCLLSLGRCMWYA